MAAIAFGHMPFFSIVLWRAVRTGHVAIPTANAHIFIDNDKAIFTFVHRAARTHFGTGWVFAVVTRNGEVIGKDVLMPDAVILLPVTARVFINAAEADFRG